MKTTRRIARGWITTSLFVALLGPATLWAKGHEEHGHGVEHVASGHGHHSAPEVSDINWVDGLFSRPEGTPVPVVALLINTAVLFFLLGRFGGPAIREGLKGRQKRIAQDIEAAREMKETAIEQLAFYKEKLERFESEMKSIQDSMREQAELERTRVLKEAEERRLSLEREARARLERELVEARKEALRVAVSESIRAAERVIKGTINGEDQERLGGEFAQTVGASATREVSA